MNGTVKLWVGVGVWVLASTSTAALLADSRLIQPALAGTVAGAGGEGDEATPPPAAHKMGDEGGEGGETGHVADGLEALPPDVAYATRLLLIRGHLRVGHELVEAGHMTEAHAHFMHPVDEVYDGLKAGLKTRKVAPFKSKLEALAETAEAGDKAGFPAAFMAASGAVDTAWAALAPASRNGAGLAAATISALVSKAAEEYGGAVADGRVTDPVPYQEARGFVAEAQDLFTHAKAAMTAQDADSAGRIGTVLAELATTFPAVMPPAAVVKAPGEVTALASRIALVAGDFK